MRILIIGGTKFIGPHVVRRFAEQGHDLLLYHRGETEADLPESVRHIRDPLAAIPVVRFPGWLLEETFDVIIHMISMSRADARAAMQAFRGRARRMVALSSGDVYLAYGRFIGLDRGAIETGLLREDSPLRTALFPYRKQAHGPDDWMYNYEKIFVEREVLNDTRLPGVVLRLPKVYGPGGNADLATVYKFRHHPDWRWTHGYVENVADAIVLAASHPAAAGKVFNIGEASTPTVSERLAGLPSSTIPVDENSQFNFAQDIAYDTSLIRNELGYLESVSYEEGLRRTLRS